MRTDLFVTGGPVPPSSPFYIDRPADNKACGYLERMEYITIVEPRQQGKTSLINSLAHSLRDKYLFTYINAMLLDKTDETSWYESLYQSLLPSLPFFTPDFESKTPTNGYGWGLFLTTLAMQAKLAGIRVVIALDELGDIWMNWRIDFFSKIRAIFDQRFYKPHLQYLTFIFAGAYSPRTLMNDLRTSPFNIAQQVHLQDFTASQTRHLVSYLDLPDEETTALAQTIHYWTDGQPYLTQYLCRYLAEGYAPLTLKGVDDAVNNIYGEDNSPLPRILEYLEAEQNLPLRDYVEKVMNGYRPLFRPASDSIYHGPLALIGILKADEQGCCKVRNQIYEYALRNVFMSLSLGKENNMSSFTDGYAVIIGIANYPKVRKLPGTVLKDARDIQSLLQSLTYCGYRDTNVRVLLDEQASIEGIRAALSWLADVADPKSTALIFFSGHGGRVEEDSQANHYLIPYNCDPVNLQGTAISGEELTRLLRNIHAQRLLVCFDSCYSGGVGEAKGLSSTNQEFKSGLNESYFAQLAQGTGRVIMASSRSDEESLVLGGMNNSLFTHYLLEALRGQASTHNDGLIRVFDVFHYVAENVPKHSLQHPIFKATDLENNFPIAMYLGGKRVESVEAITTPIAPQYQHSNINKKNLRKFLAERFTIEDLQVLCADIEQNLADDGIDLQVSLERVGGTSQEARALNLIRYLDNNGRLDYLVNAVHQHRPNLF